YVKGDLKQVIAASNLPDDPALGGELARVFPVPLVERFGEALQAHQLRREIIATRVANDLVDHVGITFVDRLRQSTGASVSAVALAYLIARDVFNVDQHWCAIEQLDNRIPATLQVQMMNELARLVRRASRWLLRNRRSELNVRDHMTRFTRAVQEMVANLPDYLGQAARDEWQARHAELNEQGVPDALARVVAGAGYLYTALGIVEAQEATGMPLAQVARVYYTLGERLELTWFARAISKLAPSGHWQALARESYREDLDWQQRSLTVGVLRQADNVEDLDGLLDGWMNQHASLVERWKQMLAEFRGIRDPEYAMFSVALRELLDLAQSTAHGIASVG
ncbi:MAG: NAD-glutamate dehydrogenase, partial [Gammaproteobacteria bacterium]|nr:NAD-glutamate dehydrogenase [Gammaproteobacteria bacterium]